MKAIAEKWWSKEFPRNFIIKYPLYGSLLIAFFTIIFALLYNPLGAHPGRFLGYTATMVAYALISGVSLFAGISILLRTNFFSKKAAWTSGKELLAVFILLLGMGIAIYFAAFIIEEPANRWNIPTLLDSLKNAFLIGIIPFLFFTLTNLRYLKIPAGLPANFKPTSAEVKEEPLQINSQLKKESLSFYPGQLIYAVSDSNYIHFYLQADDKIRKKVIRNTMNNIESQLQQFPYFIRTHRAFMVNLKKVTAVKGNSLGYHLKLQGIDQEIPVSRANTKNFSQRCIEFC